jgi:type II secretory pathway pseudopilin PulG
MRRSSAGFSYVELALVVVILGIMVAIAVPNFMGMEDRAKEGSTKANMHTFQLAAEQYAVQNQGAYAGNADAIAALLPNAGDDFRNPFDRTTGDMRAWRDVAAYSPALDTGSPVRGVVAYADSATVKYVIAGNGHSGTMSLRLFSGP